MLIFFSKKLNIRCYDVKTTQFVLYFTVVQEDQVVSHSIILAVQKKKRLKQKTMNERVQEIWQKI